MGVSVLIPSHFRHRVRSGADLPHFERLDTNVSVRTTNV